MGALKATGRCSDFLRRPKDYKQNKICFLLAERIANSSVLLPQGNCDIAQCDFVREYFQITWKMHNINFVFKVSQEKNYKPYIS
jgi:hypothetical protein